jgi:heat shock protein HslJ
MLDLRQAIAAFTALVLVAFLVACGGHGEPPEPSIDPSLDNTEWVLTMLRGSDLIEGSNITLHFAEGRVSGFGGCNSYGGDYTVADKGAIAIPELEITLQLCELPQGTMAQEEAYVEALRSAAAYLVSNAHLEIANAASETTLQFTKKAEFAMDPDDLAGTEWQLLSWNGGSPVKGLIITMAFAQDKIHGHAGCRGYRGTCEAKGDGIRFPRLEMTEIHCLGPEPLRLQEGEYTTYLEGATNYRVAEGQLETLTV